MTTRAAGLPPAGRSQVQSAHASAEHPRQHQPLSAREAHSLTIDLAGAAAAATLMLVLTCWMLSLVGAFQPGHVETHGAGMSASAGAKH
jgi:hypothetical protein